MSVEDVVDFVAQRAKQDPKVRQIVQDVRLFDGLQEHAGWRRLYEKVKADRDRFLTVLTSRLMSGEEVSQREIDYKRGYYEGAEWVLGHPAHAAENLERAARRAWTLAQLEATAEEEESSPYT